MTRFVSMIALAVPVFCAVMGVRTGRYPWNLGVTGACMAIVCLAGGVKETLPLLLALAFSVAGDYFMAHKAGRTTWYIMGIAGFLAGHLCFIAYALGRFAWRAAVIAAAVALAAGYAMYLTRRVLPHVFDPRMRAALVAYTFVSVAALSAALSMRCGFAEKALYALGIALILFSDTMIGEADFAGAKNVGRLIMPTYYACHIFVTASVFFR